MADMQTLTINGATYTIKDATARENITDLKSAIDKINDLEYPAEEVYVDDLTYGRISPTGIDTRLKYIAYSPTMRQTGDIWSFDTTQFRLLFAFYDTDTSTDADSVSNAWITTSPAKVPTTKPYYKLMVSRLTDTGILDIDAAERNVHQEITQDSNLIDFVTATNSHLTEIDSHLTKIDSDISAAQRIYYVATTGNDGNDGSKSSPFKTITKALDSNATHIFVTPGTYSEKLYLSGKSHLIISPYYPAFSTSDFSAKIVLDGINTRPYLINISDCQNLTLIGIKAINFTTKGFRVDNSTNVRFFNCEASEQYGTYQYGIGFELFKTNAEFNDCVAHDVKLDGFNMHDYGDTVFNNCVAYNCGDDGISHHDACVGHIKGGEFYNCGKGGVSSPTYGAYVDVESVYSHNNVYGLYTSNSSGNRNCKAHITNCAFADNSTYDVLISGTDAIGWNNIYDTKSVAADSTFTELS